MKRTSIILALFAATTAWAQPQGGFGFGGQQLSAEQMHYSQKFSDINYAGDDKAYHTLDIYLPEKRENEGTGERGNEKYPVVVHIYGSAWFSNSSKGMADLGTICAALLKAGYAVVTPRFLFRWSPFIIGSCHFRHKTNLCRHGTNRSGRFGGSLYRL